MCADRYQISAESWPRTTEVMKVWLIAIKIFLCFRNWLESHLYYYWFNNECHQNNCKGLYTDQSIVAQTQVRLKQLKKEIIKYEKNLIKCEG